MDRFIGKTLDNRYEILEVIGTGGMAVVYKAKCHRLNRFVALKMLKDECAKDEEFRRRFHDESQSVAMLSHPNIVSVYDVSKTDQYEYIVMELIEGITLKEFMARRGQMPWNEATFFAIQIAKALEHAHSRGIIHRDIKPQNIMLLRDGTLKVADFGIARQVDGQQTQNISETIGSVHYISPEQAKGSHIDNRADLYSAGVVLYEMLTGRLPFEGDNAVSVAIQHIRSTPLAPSDIVTDLPKTLEAITMKAMNPNLSGRYSSASQMLSDLERFKNDPEFRIEMMASDNGASSKEQPIEATIKMAAQPQMARAGRKSAEPVLEEEDKKRSRVSKSMIFSIVSVVIFFIGAIYFMVSVINPFGGKTNEKLSVPDFFGVDYEEAIVDEQYTDFNIVKGEEVYHESAAAGQIISQEPLANRSASVGDTITVVVSRGKKTVTLDNYIGKEYRQAEIDIKRQGLEVIPQFEFAVDVETDYVIRTEPAMGEEIASGGTVVLVISKGKELKDVAVPSVIGKAEAEAKKAIEGAGLVFGTSTPIDSDKADGTVIFQSIPAESKVKEGTIVDIQISRNKAPVEKSKTISFAVIEAEGEVMVEVQVNGETQYQAPHITADGEIMVPLLAKEGYNNIKIVQNGTTTYEENMLF